MRCYANVFSVLIDELGSRTNERNEAGIRPNPSERRDRGKELSRIHLKSGVWLQAKSRRIHSAIMLPNTGPLPTRSKSRDDPLSVLDEEDPIFANEDLLRIDHIPDHDKIGRSKRNRCSATQTDDRRWLGDSSWATDRQDTRHWYVSLVKPSKERTARAMTFALAKSGSGKTLVTRYVIHREVEERGASNDVRIVCGRLSTNDAVIAVRRKSRSRRSFIPRRADERL